MTEFSTTLAQNAEINLPLPSPTEESLFPFYPCGTDAFQADSSPLKQGSSGKD